MYYELIPLSDFFSNFSNQKIYNTNYKKHAFQVVKLLSTILCLIYQSVFDISIIKLYIKISLAFLMLSLNHIK